MKENKAISLYNHFKNTPKKLKIVCDWDEVIQATEPFAFYQESPRLIDLVRPELATEWKDNRGFPECFKSFWTTSLLDKPCPPAIEYFPYGSRLKINDEEITKKQIQIKNSPNLYQQAPFLIIAEDLVKLIKEDKVEKLIFLSAYDKSIFPNGDPRKEQIFNQTFDYFKVANTTPFKVMAKPFFNICELYLIPFDNETQGQSKADWIKQNASDFDIVIDDNPYICRSVAEIVKQKGIIVPPRERDGLRTSAFFPPKFMTVIAPHYSTTANQHDKRVLLVKNEVSSLKKEDFNINN